MLWLFFVTNYYIGLEVQALAHSLPEFHDVLDLIPHLLHDALVRLVLLVDLVHCTPLAHVLVRLDQVERDDTLAALTHHCWLLRVW